MRASGRNWADVRTSMTILCASVSWWRWRWSFRARGGTKLIGVWKFVRTLLSIISAYIIIVVSVSNQAVSLRVIISRCRVVSVVAIIRYRPRRWHARAWSRTISIRPWTFIISSRRCKVLRSTVLHALQRRLIWYIRSSTGGYVIRDSGWLILICSWWCLILIRGC